MSKKDDNRVTIDVAENETLQILDIAGLMKEEQAWKRREDAAKLKRKNIKSEIEAALNAAGAEIATYTDKKNQKWTATFVPPGVNYRLDEQSLKKNMLGLGLDATTIQKVITSSKVRSERTSYVKVSYPKNGTHKPERD